MFDARWRTTVERGTAPASALLRRTGVTADQLTASGLVLAVAAAVVVASGHLIAGALLVGASGLPDLLDGPVAKASGCASPRGAFFDSVSDRVTDALLLAGVAWYLAGPGLRTGGGSGHLALLPLGVLAASMLVSYIRAKAESLGLSARGGLMERAERLVGLAIGLVVQPFLPVLVPVLWAMLLLTALTALQRFVSVWRQAPSVRPVESPERRWRAGRVESRWRGWREEGQWGAAQRGGGRPRRAGTASVRGRSRRTGAAVEHWRSRRAERVAPAARAERRP